MADEWTCPRCGGHDRVIVTNEYGTSTRCLTPGCGYREGAPDTAPEPTAAEPAAPETSA